MNFFAAYHSDIRPQDLGVCDAPQISKGQMILSGFETASEPGRMALAFGRMHNRTVLARRLNCAPGASQAQLALSAYERWGDDFAMHLHGPCLYIVADVEKDRMIVVRDRMGETMLFYSWRHGSLALADHPDMLLKSGFVEPIAGREELCELFALGPARTPGKTPLRDINTIPAGCMLVCEKGECTLKRYYAPEAGEHSENEENTIEHTRFLLEQCVDETVHLHPACMLSGGIDSTALTALLGKRIGRLQSFSVDYRGNDEEFIANDFRPEMDAPYIRQAVHVLGTRHRSIMLEQDWLAGALDAAVAARGFPGMADIDASLLLFARGIVREAPCVVSGECGDEVFGGYPWFREGADISGTIFPWSGSMDLRASILRPEIREKLNIHAYARDCMQLSMEAYDVSAAPEEERALFRLQRLCFDYFMPNLQERAVQMCAACGLNVLTPLCDERLVEYIYRVPWKMKRMGGMEKGLLRAAMQGLLPEKLRMRKKSPYPKTCSAAYTDIIREKMRALAADNAAPLWKIVDLDAVQRIASSALDPASTPWFGQLMAGPQLLAYLLQINSWMQNRNITVNLE